MAVNKETTRKVEKTTLKATETKNDNTMAVLTHLLVIFVGFLGPLIILIISKDKNIKNHARKALNWQITYFIITIIIFGFFFMGILTAIILTKINPLFFILFVLSFSLLIPLIALSMINIILCIIAAIKANEGILWNYPLTFNFLKME